MFGIHYTPEVDSYWSLDPRLRVPAVADIMGKNRYKKINQYLHLNDNENFVAKGQPGYDPLFKIRPLMDIIEENIQKNYYPGRELSIDEAMISFNGRLFFKQYIKSKPTPWGIKVWCIADPRNGYMCNFQFYTGKVHDPMPHGIGHHVIFKVGSPYLDKGHHFYFDNYFSSVKLAEDLLTANTHSCATIRTNRKGWPLRKKKMKGGELRFLQKGRLLATTWCDKRQVSILSTNVEAGVETESRRSKEGPRDVSIPKSILTYNRHMGGVDLADQ